MRLISCLAKQTTEGKWKPGLYDSTHRQTLHGKWRRNFTPEWFPLASAGTEKSCGKFEEGAG